MIYLGNGLYSDSGHSLMHYGVRGMRWARDKRETDIDWSNPTEVAAYYADKRGANDKRWNANRINNRASVKATSTTRSNASNPVAYMQSRYPNDDKWKANGVNNSAAVRAVSIGRQGPLASVTKRGSSNAATAQQDPVIQKYIKKNLLTQSNGRFIEPKHAEPSGGPVIPRPRRNVHQQNSGSFVTPRSPRDVKNRADTIKQPNGGFVTPRPNNTSGRAKADTEKSPSGGFVAPRSSAERRAADDRARSPRGGFMAPRPGYVTRDQDDKKRSPKGGPHFATKEYQQEQVNARMRKKSADDYRKSFNDQVDRKGHGTLNDWYETDHKLYVGDRGTHKRGNKTDRYVDVNKAIEAGRRRHRGDAGIRGYQTTSSQSDQGINYDAGLKAARERARKNSQNKSDTKHNQDKRGTGTRPNITNHPQTADTRTSQKNRGYQTSLTQKDSGIKNYDAGLEAARKRALEKKKKKTKGEQRSKAKDWYFNNWVKKHLPGG